MMDWCYLNGKIVLTEKATISVQDRGFRYGDGLFETIAVYHGVPYQWAWHVERLEGALKALTIPVSTEDMLVNVQQVIKKNKLDSGFIRIAISRGAGGSGYMPSAKNKPTVLIEAMPRTLKTVLPAQLPAQLYLSSYKKPSSVHYPVQFKTAQGLNSTLALLEAREQGCDEALLLSDIGQLCEASSANLFWIQNGNLFTPPLSSGCLMGSTRAAVIRLSPVPVRERPTSLEKLKGAEMVFLTNCNRGIWPVTALLPAGWSWPNGHPITEQIQELYLADIKGQCKA